MGSPRYIAAPMVDASELPFRLLAREFGAQLCFTPMMHSRLLAEQPGYLDANFSTCAGDRPLIAQLCGKLYGQRELLRRLQRIQRCV